RTASASRSGARQDREPRARLRARLRQGRALFVRSRVQAGDAREDDPMKITTVDTFTLQIPTTKPIALDLPEHRLVVTRVRTDMGLDGLGYALVFGGAGSGAVQADAPRPATPPGRPDPTPG